MPIPLIPIAGAIASAVAPAIGRWLGGDDGEEVAKQVVGVAKRVTGVEDEATLPDVLRQDPQAAAQVQTALMDLQARLAEAEADRLRTVNETMQAETQADDRYVRRWRPTWGYVTAVAWLIQALAIVGCLGGAVWATVDGQSSAVSALLSGAAELAGALTVQWSVALAVLGINVAKRSDDKAVRAGVMPARGLLGAVAERLAGRADNG